MADPVFLKAPEGNYVTFDWDTEKNEEASIRENRPMFDKVLIMQIHSPGAPKSIPAHVVEREKPGEESRPVEFHYRKYKAQIEAFKADATGGDMAGTPLDQLPMLDMATKATMRAMNIHTIEALAELPENGIQNLGMGARTWKTQAAAFLEQANGGAPLARLAAENEDLKSRLAELAERMEALEKPQAKPQTKPKAA